LKVKASSIVETKSLLDNYISKIPIGTDGEYVLGYTISQMHKCGIKDSVLLVNYE